jgi:hypothetical protein
MFPQELGKIPDTLHVKHLASKTTSTYVWPTFIKSLVTETMFGAKLNVGCLYLNTMYSPNFKVGFLSSTENHWPETAAGD